MEIRLRCTPGGLEFAASRLYRNQPPEMEILIRNGTVQMQFNYNQEIYGEEYDYNGSNYGDYDEQEHDETLDGSGESMSDLPWDEEDEFAQNIDQFESDDVISISSISDVLNGPEQEEDDDDDSEFNELVSASSVLHVSPDGRYEMVLRHTKCCDDTDSDF